MIHYNPMTNHEIWQAVLAELELSISKANFVTWFKNTGIINYHDGQTLLCVPNNFTHAWLEKKYHSMIIASLERVTGKAIKKLEYKIENIKNLTAQNFENQSPAPASTSFVSSPWDTATAVTTAISTVTTAKILHSKGEFLLNPKYDFSNFVVGKGSELAYAAAQAIVNKPGEAYNPLFVYGGVGLGKTHLIQAIGNQMRKNNPSIMIMYASAEKFCNDFVASTKEGTAKNFQNRYRNVDLLLIDDIQFISGRDRTQESFFHTFNELHQQNKQIVMTSDRPPKAIPALEDRLKSRFEWGMIVDVAPPDLETRIAILQTKCGEKNFPLELQVIQLVATTIHNNIRELEGALNKIVAFHQLKNMVPTKESVQSLLTSLTIGAMRRSVTADQMIDTVSQFYGITVEDMVGQSREKKFSYPRQVAMYLMRKELNMSYPTIGEDLGGRDHTTAMHADNKINMEIDNDLKLKQEVELIKQRLYINSV